MLGTKEQVHEFLGRLFEPVPCTHSVRIYQPQEDETNIPESFSCNDCGKEFEIPQEDPNL
tara:strand:- start:721 stop:900 length:180 start_codon:yes stop_codon:yes gene_type:complete